MAITLTNYAFHVALNNFIVGNGAFALKLFTDSGITPSASDTTGTYTEATFTGYASQNISFGTVTSSPPIEVDGTAIVFTSSADQSPQTIYGAMIVDVANNLCGAQLFSSPVTIQNNGDNVTVTPTLTMGQC